jgi:carbamoyltransferase
MSRSSTEPIVLGLSGGTAPVRPRRGVATECRMAFPFDTYHDSAAALVGQGRVLAAMEQERFNRLKHTNRFALQAIRACLASAQLTIRDVDRIAYYTREDLFDELTIGFMLRHASVQTQWTGRSYLAQALAEEFDHPIDPAQLTFVEHHHAHAMSAYGAGPFAEALVVTLDGRGDGVAGTVWSGTDGALTRLYDVREEDSLGHLYLQATRYLAYDLFDEYKVMGLAAYGDSARYRHLFDALVILEPEGRFKVQTSEWVRTFAALPPARRAGEPLTREHRDVAAAVQEAAERAATHLLTHYRHVTGHRHLCLAGGFAHNSTMIGKIARSKLFEGLFVQPAASDAGCALGAALVAHQTLAPRSRVAPMRHAFCGQDLGDDETIARTLAGWTDFVQVRRRRDISQQAAQLLADDAAIGWVQGRSEFGPRALGNRSILADPRPASNKDRINQLVKHREDYRPFAPAVLIEHADAYFDIPAGACADFMTMTVPVRPHVRALLGAVTHVDGTARVQTVRRETNPRFHALIEAFMRLTGVPVLLNTSFNHSVEPIVDSVDDAMACFLTTGLDALVAGDAIVTRREPRGDCRFETLVPSLPEYVRIVQARHADGCGGFEDTYMCEHIVTPSAGRVLTRGACTVLQRCDGHRPLGDLLEVWPVRDEHPAIVAELDALWRRRLVTLRPFPAAWRPDGDQHTDETVITTTRP